MAGKSSVIKVEIVGDASSVKRALGDTVTAAETTEERAGGSLRRVGEMASAFLIAKAVPAAIGFGQEMFTLGSTLDTWSNKADTVFGESVGTMRSWADDVNESLGKSDEEVLNLATNMGDLLKPMGFTADQAADMSQEMVGLSGALSAWSGGEKDAAEVSDILTKAMLGEREQLKGLGISLTEADVKARLAAKGQDTLTGTALEQAKALATQELILEKSTDAQDAWADGTMDAVKAQNESKATIADLKASIATGLQPAFQAATAFVAGTLIPTLTSLGGFVSDNKELFIAAAVGIATVFVPALVAWAVSAGAAALATIAAAAPVIALTVGAAALAAGIVWLYKNVDWFRAAIDKAGDAVQWVWGNALKPMWGWLSGTAAPFITGTLVPAIGSVATKIGEWVGKAAEVVSAVTGKFDEIVGFVWGLPGRIGMAASGMFDGIKNAFRGAINWIIRRWNTLSFGIPSVDLGPLGSFGGQSFRVPQIREFAQGGIVKGGRGGVLAMVGEGRHDEIVQPLPRGAGGAAGGAMGGVTYNVRIELPFGADYDRAGAEVARALQTHLRKGGALNVPARALA